MKTLRMRMKCRLQAAAAAAAALVILTPPPPFIDNSKIMCSPFSHPSSPHPASPNAAGSTPFQHDFFSKPPSPTPHPSLPTGLPSLRHFATPPHHLSATLPMFSRSDPPPLSSPSFHFANKMKSRCAASNFRCSSWFMLSVRRSLLRVSSATRL